MNVIDLFSGVGGFSTGLKKAGFNIILANEIDSQIALSYKKNHDKTLMINSDISEFITNYQDLIEKNIVEQNLSSNAINQQLSNVDIIVGGPPCQGFSMAGKRIRRNYSFINDSRNYLFKKYFEIIQKFEPEYFIFENVIGIMSMNNGDILKEIEQIFTNDQNFKDGAYYIQKKVFLASDFGVPQNRRRFILIGSKKPFDIEDVIQKTFTIIPDERLTLFKEKHSVYDAISDLSYKEINEYKEIAEYKVEPKTELQRYLRGKNSIVYNHLIPPHSQQTLDRIRRIKQGENWQNLAEKDSIKSVHSGAYGRLIGNEQSVTITTRFDTPSAGRFIHPDLDRNITIREAARIQTFPDSFIFDGNKTSICKQIGNAVPPMLAEFLGYMIIYIKTYL